MFGEDKSGNVGVRRGYSRWTPLRRHMHFTCVLVVTRSNLKLLHLASFRQTHYVEIMFGH